MNIKSFILLAAFLIISTDSFSQKSQMKVAQNAVGKLQAAIASGQDKAKQLSVIGEGIKATESAQKDRRTKNWPETWAIKSYLSSYVALIDENESNSERHYKMAIEALNTAKELDRFQNNTSLIDAATHNIILKKQDKASKAYLNNDFKNAFELLREVSDFFPNDTTLAINTGLSAKNIGDLAAAQDYFKRALQNGAKNPTLFQSIATIYTSKFENDMAISTLERGMELNPNNSFLNNNYINLLIDNEKYDKAIKAIEKTLPIESKNKLLYFLYGYLNQQHAKNSTAELAYKKALELDANYFDALYQLGIAYIDVANNALKSNDSTNTQTFNSNINRAELTLLQANEINPNDRSTVQLLTEIYARKNKFDKVQELKRKLEEF
ncbi:tetratricopeptide repeat protein [Pedobacter immunditicola]|uniref:tetratricopeptide repeat protein n=1 Tax=Pedobacter immunditicola TaxID=3133440 RepID=UPI0030A245BF